MAKIEEVDLAKVDKCAGGCGVKVRRFPSVPISGNGLDASPSGPWWCNDYIDRNVREAIHGA